MKKLNDDWLYKTHSRSEIQKWVTSLELFHFCRAWGGHANDGDTFELYLHYSDKENFLVICKKLGFSVKELPPNTPEPIPGKPYPSKEFERFKSKIKDFPEYEQPGNCIIFGCPVFIWIENGRIIISLSGAKEGNLYEVTEVDFENCLKIERAIQALNISIDNSIEERITCISRQRYPELWE